MNVMIRLPLVALALACAAPLAACPLLTQAEPDWTVILGQYPMAGSAPALGERMVLLWLQKARTPEDVQRANGANTPSFGCFAKDIDLAGAGRGLDVDFRDFPQTQAILDHAQEDLWPVLQTLKNTYGRPRPYLTVPGLEPALPLVSSPSFPSGSAVLGCFFACIIGQYAADDKDALEATGRLLGMDRVLGGVHYPSDVEAGQRFGHAYATWWINQHKALIQTACGEWSAARAKARAWAQAAAVPAAP
jgi:acid phosphatase (class A)